MAFGQLVVGPPGIGKTTYCNGMQQFLTLTGRKVAVVNLDPANDALPYEYAVDIQELISLEAVQAELGLGPNGGECSVSGRVTETSFISVLARTRVESDVSTLSWLTACSVPAGLVYCIDFLEQNLDWLNEKLEPFVRGVRLILWCHGTPHWVPLQAQVQTSWCNMNVGSCGDAIHACSMGLVHPHFPQQMRAAACCLASQAFPPPLPHSHAIGTHGRALAGASVHLSNAAVHSKLAHVRSCTRRRPLPADSLFTHQLLFILHMQAVTTCCLMFRVRWSCSRCTATFAA